MKEFFNLIYYHWKRSNWLVDPRTWISHFKDIQITNPIFFVGNQGGGLTLISRMIRRHRNIINITGNNDYWSGADEMHRVMVSRLPKTLRLSGGLLKSDPEHERFSQPRSWSYGSDDLVDKYHLTEKDYSEEVANRLKTIIGEAIYRFGDEEGQVRFLDKSQSYTLKMRYIEALLRESDPYFVLISREPVAACYRQASGRAGGDMKRYADFMDFNERLEVCMQHWCNTMNTALEDGKSVERFTHFKFEDFLRNPAERVGELCDFLELEYSSELIPQAHHNIPFGTRYTRRWHPLRQEVNEKYYREMSENTRDKILNRCGDLSEKLGYKY